ncbi:transketolase-like protein 2 [Drosophila eugracilis]|uniref:transketolase-like protein 2 n=1 Tax=Drosophila eugracilis TaxID=29029 RepID=UPI0007E872BA|nr:transketolase-like protein 2 [Drosophila eugracilis]
MTSPKLDSKVVQNLKDMAHKLRIHSINSTQAAKSGHPTSCASLAEIMTVLFFQQMRLNVKHPRDPSSDRLILSKGHAAPILYAAWAEAGLFPVEELLNLRKVDSDLEGHPTPRLSFIDVGTGSMGQGISVATGMAYVGKYLDKAEYRTYVLLGDKESVEGSVWEALHFAGHYCLDNLCVIFDINNFFCTDPATIMEVYRERLDAFGFNALVLNGHDIDELVKAFHNAANTKGKPTALLARTIKGKDFLGIEGMDDMHGQPLGKKAEAAIKNLQMMIANPNVRLTPKKIGKCNKAAEVDINNIMLCSSPNYRLGDSVAPRMAYGTALAKIAADNCRVIALDGDTKNSTYADKMRNAFPERFIECFIAQQNLVGVAIGATCRRRTVAFVSTYSSLFTRAFDQIRMGAISRTNVNFVGSHCGCSIGEDGPSLMGLEDIAMFRSIPGSTVFYPTDAVSTERAVELAANTKGVCFIRTTYPNTTVIYNNDEVFAVGLGKVVRQKPSDEVLLIGAGVTLYECLVAAERLEEDCITARVIDPFTVKPLDVQLIVKHGKLCRGRIIVVEDHYQQGGLGEAVLSALADYRNFVVKHLYVPTVPRSGPPAVLLDMFGISSRSIYKASVSIMKK